MSEDASKTQWWTIRYRLTPSPIEEFIMVLEASSRSSVVAYLLGIYPSSGGTLKIHDITEGDHGYEFGKDLTVPTIRIHLCSPMKFGVAWEAPKPPTRYDFLDEDT